MNKKSVFIITYGCTLNRGDSEIIAGILSGCGFSIAEDPQSAGIIVVNTCTVKTPTEKKIFKKLKSLEDSKKSVVVAGCIPPAIPGWVDIFKNFSFIGTNTTDIADAVAAAATAASKGKRLVNIQTSAHRIDCPKIRYNPICEIVPIADGCLGSCAYCQTKKARGDLRSYSRERIIKRIVNAVKDGVVEIWLTAQDTGAYGCDIGCDLADLLKNICEITGEFKVRVGMMNPAHTYRILDKLIEIYKNEKIYKFIHLPVQSGSDKVLCDMNRGYSVRDFIHIVETLRCEIPGITISTDIIAGFPTETESDHDKSVSLIKKIKPDIVNISRYWMRGGTESAKLKGHHGRVTKHRSRIISKIFQDIALEKNKKWIGWEGNALVSELKDDLCARNFAYKPIILKEKIRENRKIMLGDSVRVRIYDASFCDLKGEIV